MLPVTPGDPCISRVCIFQHKRSVGGPPEPTRPSGQWCQRCFGGPLTISPHPFFHFSFWGFFFGLSSLRSLPCLWSGNSNLGWGVQLAVAPCRCVCCPVAAHCLPASPGYEALCVRSWVALVFVHTCPRVCVRWCSPAMRDPGLQPRFSHVGSACPPPPLPPMPPSPQPHSVRCTPPPAICGYNRRATKRARASQQSLKRGEGASPFESKQ